MNDVLDMLIDETAGLYDECEHDEGREYFLMVGAAITELKTRRMQERSLNICLEIGDGARTDSFANTENILQDGVEESGT
jgi:chloramphenicol 3-O-phosphotransferase